MKQNIIVEEIFKVLKAKRVYRKALKYINIEAEICTRFGSWFSWSRTHEGSEFWDNVNPKVYKHLELICKDSKLRLAIYEYLLEVFGTSTGYKRGFCAALGSIDLEWLPELMKQNPRIGNNDYWYPRSPYRKDEPRCNALLEAIRLVKLEINDSQTLSTTE